jgi:hypothetical protein
MLKITITDTPTEQKWILSGRLTEPWVSELRSNWTNTSNARQGRHCIIDLEGVTFIDQNGECALVAMMGEGAQFVASGVCTKHLLEHLRNRDKRGLRKCMEYLPDYAVDYEAPPASETKK